jgi:hypothetical protein
LDAILIRVHHIKGMTTYAIIPNGDGTGFNISIAGSDGARQTMLGFQSEAEAEAWILQDKRLSAIPTPQVTGSGTTAYG